MEIVLKDQDQNDILSPTLTQWDQGVTIMIRDFLYPLDGIHPYLHFYNVTKQHIYAVGTQTEANRLVYDETHKTLTCEIPNQLLMEPYPIIVHVYLTEGGAALNADTHMSAMTVFTATIGVEPRMRPDSYEENDNVGELSARQLQELFRDEIANWNTTLDAFYGTKPTPSDTVCYYDATTQALYEHKNGDTYSDEITGDSGVIYEDHDTGALYFYENETWVEWSVTGALNYTKGRADVCDQTAAQLQSDYANALDAKEIALNATFDAALNGCVIRTSTTVPTASSYVDETKPVITFVIGV